jgi:hypothetical protein
MKTARREPRAKRRLPGNKAALHMCHRYHRLIELQPQFASTKSGFSGHYSGINGRARELEKMMEHFSDFSLSNKLGMF